MTWKNAFFRAVEKELQPMRQVTYWIIFIAMGLVFVFKTVEVSAYGSAFIIQENPEVAEYSWLVKKSFF